jgi:2-keto-4-pentenoate hydratase/2-oxohepta-3-ene-1,7-dioic acid hydratase in catechol pathway
LLVGDSVIDVAEATGRPDDRDVMHLLADWDQAVVRLEAAAMRTALARPLSSVHVLAPLPMPGTIYCAGANYADHAAEMARARNQPPPPDPHTLGLKSWHFIKSSRAVVGSGVTVPLPPRSKKVDWEAEMAVVIGRKAKAVSRADALNFIAAYTIANDLSARDLSRRDGLPDTSSFKQDWVAHKNFDGSCPMGPWLTLARDIANPHDLRISLDVNGVTKQDSNTGQMIYDIGEQIEDLSHNITLWPGDVILTGTPAGVGNGRGEFLKAGDVVVVRVAGLGELVTTCA